MEEGGVGVSVFEVGEAGVLSCNHMLQGREARVRNLQLFARSVFRRREDAFFQGLVKVRNELV